MRVFRDILPLRVISKYAKDFIDGRDCTQKLAMELNYPSHAQNGKVSQSSKDSQKNWSGLLSKVMGEDSLAVAHSESTESENIKHVSSLPTVFEDRTSLKLRKFPTREQLALSNLGKYPNC